MSKENSREGSPGAADEEEFIVERVVDKRVKNGKTEYFLKWKNYPDTENTWEPEENLECPDLIADYERLALAKRQKEKERAEKRRAEGGDSKRRHAPDEKPRGFDRGLEPERILGATDSGNELTFLLKWKGTDEADLVPARIANVKCPQVVIRFYEERLTWMPHPDKK